MMLFGLELVTDTLLSVSREDYFKTRVSVNHLPVMEMDGQDLYKVSGVVFGGKRVAGTGRQKVYDYYSGTALGLGPIQASPAELFPVTLDEYSRLQLHLETNLILDPGLLAVYLRVRMVGSNNKILMEVPLKSPEVEILWNSRGNFTLNLTAFTRRIFKTAG